MSNTSVGILNLTAYNPTYDVFQAFADYSMVPETPVVAACIDSGVPYSDCARLYGGGTLYSSGCQLFNGSLDCTAACQDLASIWSNPYTLQNCLQYTAISRLMVAGNLSEEGQAVAHTFGIAGNNTFADILTENIQLCLSSYCTKSKSCGQDLSGNQACRGAIIDNCTPTTGLDRYMYNGTTFNHTQICGSVNATANADVGGIGVGGYVAMAEDCANYCRRMSLIGCSVVSL